MHFKHAILRLSLFISPNSIWASPSIPPAALEARAKCTDPVLRKEWSAATPEERTLYSNAVLCLATKPSRIGLNTTLYDDFAYVHNKLNQQIHGVAQFLPWHRYFMHLHEQALKECGYIGAAMYWDWVAASSAPASAAIWSPTDGFGGNGAPSPDLFQRCINGPFSSLRPNYYGDTYLPHCITRDFMPGHPEASLPEMLGWTYSQKVLDDILASQTYLTFHPSLESAPHATVHAAIAGNGGDMGPLTSPNDPIFFLHHTMIDRVWWIWQQADSKKRLFEFDGLEWGKLEARLDAVMFMEELGPDRRVWEFMSTQSEDLCYKY